jgi:hypothetical protein
MWAMYYFRAERERERDLSILHAMPVVWYDNGHVDRAVFFGWFGCGYLSSVT